MNVIVGYAPTEQCEEVVKDEFYQQLDVAMHKTGSLVVVLGDFNARLGKAVSKVVGQFGLSQSTSDNGVRLIEFCQAHNLGITNTFFHHKNIHTATWYPPNPKLQPSLKDYVLVKQSMQKMVHDTRVRRGPNFDNDHKLVCSKMVRKFQKPRGERRVKTFTRDVLSDPIALGKYQNNVMTTFTQRLSAETEAMWSDFCSAIMESANEHLNVVQTRKNRWISERTLQLIAEKREAHIAWMRCQENEMTRKHYVSLFKQVKQAVRHDKEEWLREQASDLEYDLKHHNHYEFFRKLKNFDHVPTQPASVILDEHGQKLLYTDNQLDHWKRH